MNGIGQEVPIGADEPLARRDFLKRTALLLGSSGFVAACASLNPASSPETGNRSLSSIGLQLYTVRGLMKRDSAGTLEAIARVGYTEIEFATLYGHTAAEMRRLLDRYGLRAVGGHVDVADVRTAWPRLVSEAHTLGWQWIICPWIDQADRTPDGYKRLAAEFNHAGVAAKAEGLRFGYHNHEFEFKPFADGTLPYDLLLAELDPAVVDMELDLYWIAKGGRDPLTYFNRYPGRFPLVHVKDMTGGGGMTNVGSGTIDFAKIFAASGRAGTKHFLVEHDEPKNPIADITASYNYLKALRF